MLGEEEWGTLMTSSTSGPRYPMHLPNSPLVEAIFELRWRLHDSGGGLLTDIGETLARWLNQAHKVAERCFFTLCRGELIEDFEEERDD